MIPPGQYITKNLHNIGNGVLKGTAAFILLANAIVTFVLRAAFIDEFRHNDEGHHDWKTIDDQKQTLIVLGVFTILLLLVYTLHFSASLKVSENDFDYVSHAAIECCNCCDLRSAGLLCAAINFFLMSSNLCDKDCAEHIIDDEKEYLDELADKWHNVKISSILAGVGFLLTLIGYALWDISTWVKYPFVSVCKQRLECDVRPATPTTRPRQQRPQKGEEPVVTTKSEKQTRSKATTDEDEWSCRESVQVQVQHVQPVFKVPNVTSKVLLYVGLIAVTTGFAGAFNWYADLQRKIADGEVSGHKLAHDIETARDDIKSYLLAAGIGFILAMCGEVGSAIFPAEEQAESTPRPRGPHFSWTRKRKGHFVRREEGVDEEEEAEVEVATPEEPLKQPATKDGSERV